MARNVIGSELAECNTDPVTGFFRNGKCDTCAEDRGMHTVCARVTDAFLAFSAEQGNDLRRPFPGAQFPGLREGDHWCLCLGRWLEAFEAGVAPPIKLEATHASVLEFVGLDVLRSYALDEA